MDAVPRKILVRAPNWVGDVVMATPFLSALRALYPQSHLCLAIRPYAVDLMRGSSLVDEIITHTPGDPKGWRGAWRFGRRLRGERFDLAFSLSNSMTTALEMYFARIPNRLGYAGDGRRPLLTRSLPKSLRWDAKGALRPMVDYYLGLLKLVGADPTSFDRRYRLDIASDQDQAVDAWLERQGLAETTPLFALNPGAKAGASKLWLPERFAAVADGLTEAFGGAAILLGGPGEEALLAKIAALTSGRVIDSGRDILGLGDLKALVARLDLMVTNDTGPRAVAQALGVPTVVILGPYDPGLTAANNEGSRLLLEDLPCRPCNRPVCPLKHHACMKSIGSNQVLQAAFELLAQS
ncbi:MAG: lipopolysaccharide heptosyltransferase II [Planctomycetota bacterium]